MIINARAGHRTDVTGEIRHVGSSAAVSTSKDTIFADLALISGDSGGPVFNDKGEVVGVISGGWFWWHSGVASANGFPAQTTWPARACNATPLRNLLKGIVR